MIIENKKRASLNKRNGQRYHKQLSFPIKKRNLDRWLWVFFSHGCNSNDFLETSLVFG